MVTGIATGYAGPIALVPLLEVDGKYQPAALPIWGTYDGYGGIDVVEPGPHAIRFQAAFSNLLHRGIISVSWARMREPSVVPATLNETCRILERALVHDERALTCDGRVLSFAMISTYVAQLFKPESLAGDSGETDLDARARMACGSLEPAASVFDGLSQEVPSLRLAFGSMFTSFIRFKQWLQRSGIIWSPPRETSQYTTSERLGFLAAARERFSKEPAVLSGLDDYEHELDLEE
ncbi:MAG: hypothetical protein QM756_43015 [Polyangiaceae bacterium]